MNLLLERVDEARRTIASGYYPSHGQIKTAPNLKRLIRAIRAEGRWAVVAQVKPVGIQERAVDGGVDGVLARFVAQEADALCVPTEPVHDGGSIANLRKAVATRLPVLMQDLILDEDQIDCAAEIGASAVILIASVLPKKRMGSLIEYAHMADREVALVVSSAKDVEQAWATEADVILVDHRDPRTGILDLGLTPTLLEGVERDRPILCMGGIDGPAAADTLRPWVDGFVVGTALVQERMAIGDLRVNARPSNG